MRLAVSIVLYETPPGDIAACLSSLEYFGEDFLLIVVDNSPSDRLRIQFSRGRNFVYIHNPANPGFGAAHNIAIRLARLKGVQYHLVLNPDILFDSDVLTPLLNFLDDNVDVGHVMPKILNPDGTIQWLCKLVPTPIDLIFRRVIPTSLRQRRDQNFELRWTRYEKIMYVPYLSGCFMLIRQSALDEVGLFDERFFMYPEDIDLTRRIARKFKTVFFPYVSVTHKHNAASRRSFRMFTVHVANMIRYFNKWGWIWDTERKALNKRTLDQFTNDFVDRS